MRRLVIALALLGLGLAGTVHVGAASYNRSAAVAWADQYAHARSGSFPNYGSGCGCMDCTNFASQVLRKGGYPLRTGNWNANSIYEWWYQWVSGYGYINSKTWSATDWFNTYTAQYPAEFQPTCWPSCLQAGDLILLDLTTNSNPGNGIPDGLPDHARIVVSTSGPISQDPADYTDGCGGSYTVPSPRTTTLINQHCTDRKRVAWDYRLPANTRGWGIHVTW